MANRCALAALVAAAALGVFASMAGADPVDNPGVPAHAGHVAFESDGAHHHHFHREQHRENPPDAREGHDVAHQLSGNQDYDATSVWVNEKYLRFDRPNSIDGKGGGSTEPDSLFSHGFIVRRPAPTPEFVFLGKEDPGLKERVPVCTLADGFCLYDHTGRAFDPRPMVIAAFAAWTAIEIDDPHLQMGLAFREKVDDDAAEIAIQFVDFQPIPRNIAGWIPGFGARDGFQGTLFFRRNDNDAGTRKHRWFIGERCADIPNEAGVDDFRTSALHETGHIVGLDHQNDTDDIMYLFAGAGDVVRAGGTCRTLSGDDILGARDLYSIPVPGSPPWILLGTGALLAIARRQRPRRPWPGRSRTAGPVTRARRSACRTVALALSALAGLHGMAQAAPIGVPGFAANTVQSEVTGDDKTLGLAITGGPVVANEGAFLTAGTSWVTDVGIQLVDRATLRDRAGTRADLVTVIGSTTHVAHPDGDGATGPGLPLSFVIVFRGDFDNPLPFTPDNVGTRSFDRRTGKTTNVIPHGNHTDRYLLDGTFARNAPDIARWNASLTGEHARDASPRARPPGSPAAPAGLKAVAGSKAVQYDVLKDDKDEFIVSLVGLPFLLGQQDEKIDAFDIGANWKVMFESIVTHNEAAPAADTVRVKGKLSHVVGPHGETDPGAVVPFDVTFSNTAAPTINGRLLRSSPEFTARHEEHLDLYQIYGVQPGPPGLYPDLLGWNLVIVGRHAVPHPPTLTLIGLGVIGAVARAWRRAATC